MKAMKLLVSGSELVKEWIHSPLKIFFICAVFLLSHLIIGGNFFNLVRLKKDEKLLAQQLIDVAAQINNLKAKIIQARDPIFLENLAKDRLDMANEDELVFVFSAE